MFFLSLRVVEDFLIWTVIFLAASFAIWTVRRRRNLIRIPVAVLSSPIAILAALFFALQYLSLGCETYSAPLYSPNRDKLVRVTTDDEGALGGNTQVELLTHHGFSSKDVFAGDWESVDIKNVHWLDNSHLAIKYDSSYSPPQCISTKAVTVTCSPRPPPPNSGSLQSPVGDEAAEFPTAKDGTYHGTDAVVLTGKLGYAIVYVGEPNSVLWSKTHWKDDRELVIATKGVPTACSSQLGVTVICKNFARE